MSNFRIAIIGQAAFSANLLEKLIERQFDVCGVFTIPDDRKTGREDILATTAKRLGVPTFKVDRWRVPPETRRAIPEMLQQYLSVKADLNILPYCNQFIPMEVIEAPKHKSINYHPSLLPRHRGAASINWTLIHGDEEAGLTIFWTDDGLDTGPILMKKSCYVTPEDTVDSLYRRFLFPAGIDALLESVELIRAGQAPCVVQPVEGATYDPILRNKDELTRVPFDKITSTDELHNFIRGMDKVPGAWINIKSFDAGDDEAYERVRLFSSSIYDDYLDYGQPETLSLVKVESLEKPGIIHEGGLLLFPNRKSSTKATTSQLMPVNVGKVQLVKSGKTILAKFYGSEEANRPPIELNEEEQRYSSQIRDIWLSILPVDVISNSTDFFYSGAGSMDVTRLVEEVKDIIGDGLQLENEDVYMATQFEEFVQLVMLRLRGQDSSGSSKGKIEYDATVVQANKMVVRFPTQLFINNKFVSSLGNKTMACINPTDESTICHVQAATSEDVDRAVNAARRAADDNSEWRRMNARDRGKLLNKLADLMEQHQSELATLESLDSGAVYTLALKTHIGMSIDAFRYFAGCCDKIQGTTIPINNARPNSNFAYTERQPIGVCGIITPWNYPLMMVSWKSAACLAAGNTLVLKPAGECPLTTLKWAELVAKAGFPPGVVNIITGRGSECGQAILDHPDIHKLGFTGSTPTGKQVMKSCAASLKRCSLELGGKSPLIIFADADFQSAVKFAMSSVFFNKGENCIAAGRLFVENRIHDKLVHAIAKETCKMTIDDPLKRSTSHGPQNHRKHLDSLIEFCQRGQAEGAKLVCGGIRLDRKGFFFMPTIFTEVEDEMYIAQEESFGPIMVVSRFKNEDIDGVIKRANRTCYGLASGVLTANTNKARKVAARIKAGTCFINTYNKTDVAAPFGGFKQSGFGKDLGLKALDDYLLDKTVIEEY